MRARDAEEISCDGNKGLIYEDITLLMVGGKNYRVLEWKQQNVMESTVD